MSGSARASRWFILCSSCLCEPSCQEWAQNHIRAQGSCAVRWANWMAQICSLGQAARKWAAPWWRGGFLFISCAMQGWKGDTYGWPCSRAQEHREQESLPLLWQCFGSLTAAPTPPDAEVTDWRVDLLRRVRGIWATQSRTIWGDVDVPGNVIQAPAALSSCHAWCVASHLLCSHPRAVLLLQEIPICLRGCPSALHSLEIDQKLGEQEKGKERGNNLMEHKELQERV